MNTYKIWERDSEESEATTIEAINARDAAEDYAAERWNADYGDCFELYVRGPDGLREATVDVSFEPSFYAAVGKLKPNDLSTQAADE